MTALSFFSYKGGVGRTMALTNMAMRLVEFGKSVFILDFDLEAPGVPYKLDKYLRPDDIKTGVVDYIHEFTSKGQLVDIKTYVKNLPNNNPGDAPMWLLPAGDTNMAEYWNKLSRINWHDMFYVKGGKGVRFFLDLKEKIRKQYNPDFLLIDSRTGITELSGISLKILADEVVLMFANNEENINGTGRVLEFLYGKKDEQKEKEPKVNLVLTRIPNPSSDKSAYNKEYNLLRKLSQQFAEFSNDKLHIIQVIHTDERLQMNEQLAFVPNKEREDKLLDIYSEHFLLFERLFNEKLTKEEWQKYQGKNEAVKLYELALNENKSLQRRIYLLSEAIEKDTQKWEYYFQRGLAYREQFNYEKAIEDLRFSVQLSNNSDNQLYELAMTLIYANAYEEALKIIQQVIDRQPPTLIFMSVLLKARILERLGNREGALKILDGLVPLLSNLNDTEIISYIFTERADILRRMHRYDEAMKDIFTAIEIKPIGLLYATLAEICADNNQPDLFYLHLTTALSKGITMMDFRTTRDFYEKYRDDERFKELLRSYNLEAEDIFHNGPPVYHWENDMRSEIFPSA